MYFGFKVLNFLNLKMIVLGGVVLIYVVVDVWMSIIGCIIIEGYGLLEILLVVMLNDFKKEEIGSIGCLLLNIIVEIWDENDEFVVDGEFGEIVVKGL